MKGRTSYLIIAAFLLCSSSSTFGGERAAACGGLWLTSAEIEETLRVKSGDSVKFDENRSVLKFFLTPIISQIENSNLKKHLRNFLFDLQEKKRPVTRSHLILDNEEDIQDFLRLSADQSKTLGTVNRSKILAFMRGNLWLYGISAVGTYGLVTHFEELREEGLNWKTLAILYFVGPKLLLNLPMIAKNLRETGTLKKFESRLRKAYADSLEKPQVLTFEAKVTRKFDSEGNPLSADWNTFNQGVLDTETPIAFTSSFRMAYWTLNQLSIVPKRKFNRSARVDLVFFSKDGKRQLAILSQSAD